MLVIEEPTALDDTAPIGTFVVIAIDPAASVKLLDDQAKREAAEIAPTRCLALVDGDLNFEYVAGMQQLNRLYLLAGKGLPAHPESWAAVPVAPADAHPETERQPVQTDFPLPWPDCHLYTLCGVTGLVSRIHQHHVVGPSLPEEEYDKVVLAVMEDEERFGLEERARAQAQPTIPPREDDDERANRENIRISHTPPELHASLESFKEPILDDWVNDIFPNEESVVPRLKVSYEVWIDTSTLDDLGDPERLIAEMKRLKGIEWEWAHRVVAAEQANQPATEAWLDNLGNAEVPVSDIDSVPAYNAELDLLIKPEDAVDNRESTAISLDDRAKFESESALLELNSDSAAIYSPPSGGSHSSRGKSLVPGSPGSYTTPDMQSGCSTSTSSSLSDSPGVSRAPPGTNPDLIQRKLFPE